MTPSNQHSDEAIAAFTNDELWAMMRETETNHSIDIARHIAGAAFDRGRESKQHTDRETLRTLIREFAADNSMDAGDLADAILAAPSLSLVAARDEVLNGLEVAMLGTTDGDLIDPNSEIPAGEMLRLASEYVDALFAPGILQPSSEVEAAAHKAGQSFAVRMHDLEAPDCDVFSAARVGSGKDEA